MDAFDFCVGSPPLTSGNFSMRTLHPSNIGIFQMHVSILLEALAAFVLACCWLESRRCICWMKLKEIRLKQKLPPRLLPANHAAPWLQCAVAIQEGGCKACHFDRSHVRSPPTMALGLSEDEWEMRKSFVRDGRASCPDRRWMAFLQVRGFGAKCHFRPVLVSETQGQAGAKLRDQSDQTTNLYFGNCGSERDWGWQEEWRREAQGCYPGDGEHLLHGRKYFVLQADGPRHKHRGGAQTDRSWPPEISSTHGPPSSLNMSLWCLSLLKKSLYVFPCGWWRRHKGVMKMPRLGKLLQLKGAVNFSLGATCMAWVNAIWRPHRPRLYGHGGSRLHFDTALEAWEKRGLAVVRLLLTVRYSI